MPPPAIILAHTSSHLAFPISSESRNIIAVRHNYSIPPLAIILALPPPAIILARPPAAIILAIPASLAASGWALFEQYHHEVTACFNGAHFRSANFCVHHFATPYTSY
jgi:hypothetical protein